MRCWSRKTRFKPRWEYLQCLRASLQTRLCRLNCCCVAPQDGGGDEEADEYEDKALSSHPDADTTIIFTTGEGRWSCWSLLSFKANRLKVSLLSEFPANQIVRFLVGFTNKGSEVFTVQSLEASFRYPQDFQFYIQNVSLI